MGFSVVLDTCVLYPAHLRDSLLRLAERGLYRVLWSADIVEELRRNLIELGITPTVVDRLLGQMRVAFPDAEVTGYRSLIEGLRCDPKDRHVLAAAVRADAAVMVKNGAPATRERLVDATLALVAERGFDGVSVGDIEERAGLAPHSGALYKYFPSRLAVLEAGLERHLTAVAEAEVDLVEMPLDDRPIEIAAVSRWLLAELDAERTITHVIEREGDRLPELRDRMREGISDRGYRIAASLVERWAGTTGLTLGAAPLGMDDERFIDVFVALSAALVGIDSRRR